MNILITGGAGFIGSHLCEKFVREGHQVICLDNFLSGNLMNIRHLLDFRKFKLIKGDIRDFDQVEKLVQGVDAIFHLAAQVHVDRSYIEPKLTYEVNVMGTQNVLEAAKLHDVKRIIYASSSEVYGSARHVPINEEHPLNAPHPYGASKIAADRMCYAYTQTYGMDIAILRPFNVFGPRQRDLGYGGVISIFTRKVLSGRPPIIYGDGAQTRDYTYIDDVVNAYAAVLSHPEPLTEPVNFGGGKEISILELANLIVELCDMPNKIIPVCIEPRIGEVKRLIADANRARNLFNWEPKISLRKKKKNFISWYKNYGFEERILV